MLRGAAEVVVHLFLYMVHAIRARLGLSRSRYPGPFGVYERMARYQYVYRIRPIGRHRRFADEQLLPLREKCRSCEGEGLVWPDHPWWGALCVECEGLGGHWRCSPEEVERARCRVIARFPGVGVDQPPSFPPGRAAFDLATGESVDLGC